MGGLAYLSYLFKKLLNSKHCCYNELSLQKRSKHNIKQQILRHQIKKYIYFF